MGRAGKIVLILAGVAVAAVVAVIGAVALLVDPNDYRDRIAAAVTSATGRELVLAGPLALDLWPCCSIEVNDARLGNPPGFGDEPFAAVRKAALGLRLWPLLTARRLEVGRVALDGLDARLATLADGRDNFSFASESADAGAESAGGGLRDLDLAGIVVRDAALTWRDARDGADYAVNNLNLETGPVRGGERFPVTASLDLLDRRDQTAVALTLDATAGLDLDASRATLTGFKGRTVLSGPALGVPRAAIEVASPELTLDYAADVVVTLAEPAGTVDVEGGTDVPAVQGSFGGQSLTLTSAAATTVVLPGLRADLTLRGPALPVPQAKVTLTADRLTVESRDDSTSLALAALSGQLDAAEGDDLPGVAGRFAAAEVAVTSDGKTRVRLPALTLDLALAGKDLPGGKAAVDLALQGIDLGTDPLAGRLAQFRGKVVAAGATVEVDGSGRVGESNALEGSFRLPGLSPREVLAVLDPAPLVTADPKALTRLSGGGRWSYRDTEFGLAGLDLVLDDTRVAGSLSQTLDDKARTRFDLSLDRLDADRYLEPTPPAAKGRDGAPAAEPPTELPLASLRELRLAGRARVGELRYAGLRLAGLDVTVAADDGVVRLDPLRTSLYGGSLAGALGMDARGPRAQVTVAQQLRDVQLGGLLTDFAEITNITGRMVADLDLTATGNTDVELKRALDGRVSLALADGAYRGVDLWYEIRRGRALLRREAAPAKPAEAVTPLKVVELAGAMAQGVLTTNRFVAEVPFLRLAGQLGLDVPAEQIRGDLTASIFEAPTFDDGTSLPDLVGARLPLSLKGPLDGPKVSVDFSKMVREAVKETARQELKALQEKALGRLGLGGTPAPAPPAEQVAPADGEPAEPPPAEKKPSRGDRARGILDQLLKPPPKE